MAGDKDPSIPMVELPPDASLWAVANEARHWTASELAPLRGNRTSISSFLRVPKGRQRRLLADEVLPRQVASRPPLDREDLKARLADADRELLAMALSGIRPIPLADASYPRRLSTIDNPPLLLYALGLLTDLDRCIAVSGTRTPSQWGQRTAERLGRRLAEAGWVVTSGLAKGVDTRAHIGALAAPHGQTVAVSALPLDRVYPADNIDLARRIVDRGAVLTEHGLSQGAGKVEFLRRNRIISGLSFAHLIVETSGGGGTWAQANTAKDQGRPLLALRPPRAETRAFRGFQSLLELGATPVSSVDEGLRLAEGLWAEVSA